MYSPYRNGNFRFVNHQAGWRKTWTHIVNGHFVANGTVNSNYDGLLFYEGSTGVSELYSTDGQGGLHLQKHDTWRKGWIHILESSID